MGLGYRRSWVFAIGQTRAILRGMETARARAVATRLTVYAESFAWQTYRLLRRSRTIQHWFEAQAPRRVRVAITQMRARHAWDEWTSPDIAQELGHDVTSV